MMLFLAASIVLAVLVRSLVKLKAWDEFHHGWLVFAAFPLPLPVRLVALAIGADDAWQHWYQNHTGDLTYQSPLHRAYAWVLNVWKMR